MNIKHNQKLTDVNVKMKIPVKLRFGVDEKEYESHCFTANFAKALAIILYNGGDWMDYDDEADSYTHPLLPIEVMGGSYKFEDPWDVLSTDAAYSLSGIVLGTGTSANQFTSVFGDKGVETRIADGSATGQLTYLSNQFDYAVEVASGKIFYKVARTVQNDTAADITVNEMAYNCGGDWADYTAIVYKDNFVYTIARDVFPTPVVIAPGESKTFFFSFTVEQLPDGSYPLSTWFFEGIKRAIRRDTESDGNDSRNTNYFNIRNVWASSNADAIAHSPSTDVSAIADGRGDGLLSYITAPVRGRLSYYEFTTSAEVRFDQFVWNYGATDITVRKLYLKSNSYILGGVLLPSVDYFTIAAGTGAKLNITLEISL